jgi:hypothetical protein
MSELLSCPVEAPPRPLRLSEEIDGLLAALTEHPISLREVLLVLKGRAYTLLLIILSLPFCLPIPLPGLSTVFGSVIALIGLRLSLRMKPWLPERLLNTRFAGPHLRNVLLGTRRLALGLEVLLRPRLTWLVDLPVMHHLNGAMIFISGVLLLLPLPIPFSNILPALAIICFSAALLERDGLFVILGVIAFALTLVFFAGIFAGGHVAIQKVREWFKDVPPGFSPETETLTVPGSGP